MIRTLVRIALVSLIAIAFMACSSSSDTPASAPDSADTPALPDPTTPDSADAPALPDPTTPDSTDAPALPDPTTPDSTDAPVLLDPTTPDEMPDQPVVPDLDPPVESLAPDAASAVYSVAVQSLWFVEDYPQDFPDNAHLSLIGGATHNDAVAFWEPGVTPSPGVEDMAESGRIDIFLDEDVAPAIANGTADSSIEFREFIFSSPRLIAEGLPTMKTFNITVNQDYPRVTLLTMLGPSPDWFVGVEGQALFSDGAWSDSVALDLPLYDAGTKEGVSPVMGGIDIRPKETVELIAYDPATGTYGPSDVPQTLAEIVFTRIE